MPNEVQTSRTESRLVSDGWWACKAEYRQAGWEEWSLQKVGCLGLNEVFNREQWRCWRKVYELGWKEVMFRKWILFSWTDFFPVVSVAVRGGWEAAVHWILFVSRVAVNSCRVLCISCKLFYMLNNEWKERGVGHLYLKPSPGDKTQLLIRSDTTLGLCSNWRDICCSTSISSVDVICLYTDLVIFIMSAKCLQ